MPASPAALPNALRDNGPRPAPGQAERALGQGCLEVRFWHPVQGAWVVGSGFRGSGFRATPGYDLAPLQGGPAGADAIRDQHCHSGDGPPGRGPRPGERHWARGAHRRPGGPGRPDRALAVRSRGAILGAAAGAGPRGRGPWARDTDGHGPTRTDTDGALPAPASGVGRLPGSAERRLGSLPGVGPRASGACRTVAAGYGRGVDTLAAGAGWGAVGAMGCSRVVVMAAAVCGKGCGRAAT